MTSPAESAQNRPQQTPATEADTAARGAHIVHLLRTAQQHHVQLSLMADQKANILIGGNLILLTILFAQLSDGRVDIALLTLAITAMVAGALAVLAVLPTVKPVASHSDSFNLLFFGHFNQLTAEEYETRMRRLIMHEEDVYQAMIRDIYQIGLVLRKKYRYLRYSYRIFLIGLGLTLILLLRVWVQTYR